MSKSLKFPNDEQEKKLCEIILQGGKIHKNVSQFLRDNKLTIATADRSYCPKILIRQLIDKYSLNKDQHIDGYACLYPLTQEEFDVIVGGLLGDMWIGKPTPNSSPCGSFTHKLEHTQYVEFKYNFLKRRCSNLTIHNKYDKRSDRHYQQCFCKIAASPILTPIYQQFYKNGIKIVPEELINKLSPLGIAIWFQDDGATDDYGYKFSVDCFTQEDIEKLTKMLKTKFDINTTIQINKNKVIHITADSVLKFKNLVEPYMCDCMKYKLQIYKYKKGKLCRVDVV